MQTINEIVAEINDILKSDEKLYSTWALRNLIQEKIPLYFSDSHGVFIHCGDFVKFKISRKKVEVQKKNTWGSLYNSTSLVARNISLETPQVGEMTVDELVQAHKDKLRNERNADEQKEKIEYLQTVSIMNATGLSLDDLRKALAVINTQYYKWDKLTEKYKEATNAE